MRAAASGYLNYNGCDLSEDNLQTLEYWVARESIRRDHIQADDIRLRTLSMIWLGTRDPEAGSDVISLLDKITNSILLSDNNSSVAASEEQRYKEVFGEISQQDVAALNTFLENKALAAEQVSRSKEDAMNHLHEELSRRFRERIT